VARSGHGQRLDRAVRSEQDRPAPVVWSPPPSQQAIHPITDHTSDSQNWSARCATENRSAHDTRNWSSIRYTMNASEFAPYAAYGSAARTSNGHLVSDERQSRSSDSMSRYTCSSSCRWAGASGGVCSAKIIAANCDRACSITWSCLVEPGSHPKSGRPLQGRSCTSRRRSLIAMCLVKSYAALRIVKFNSSKTSGALPQPPE
jgi:hypothetical protein